MKEFKKTNTVTFIWWRTDNEEIPFRHKDQLTESAENRIQEMKKEGYSSGELLDEIEGVSYRGHWVITEKL